MVVHFGKTRHPVKVVTSSACVYDDGSAVFDPLPATITQPVIRMFGVSVLGVFIGVMRFGPWSMST